MSTGAPDDDSQEHALPSRHEHQDGVAAAPRPAEGADRDRASRGERPEWVEDVPSDRPGSAPSPDALQHGGSGEPRHRGDEDLPPEVVEPEVVEEAERLFPHILAKLEQHQHLHLPIQMPDPDALAELKRKDPKSHKTWLKQVGKQMEHQRFMESARYKMPLKVIRSAQLAAVTALLAILALAGYALYLDRQWFAGVLATVDVVAVVAIFAGIGFKSDD